jgi:hypothetical protein
MDENLSEEHALFVSIVKESMLKMDANRSPRTPVPIYRTKWRHISEDLYLIIHHPEKFKFHVLWVYFKVLIFRCLS